MLPDTRLKGRGKECSSSFSALREGAVHEPAICTYNESGTLECSGKKSIGKEKRKGLLYEKNGRKCEKRNAKLREILEGNVD